MYKALIEIGGYKPGQEVPKELAEVWSKMYLNSPVEEITEEKINDSNSGQEKSEVPSGNLLEDYLGRNTNVVVKNVQTDNLNKKQLNELLALERSNKKRSVVIKALEKRLEETN